MLPTLPFGTIDVVTTVRAPAQGSNFKENEDDEQEDDFHRIPLLAGSARPDAIIAPDIDWPDTQEPDTQEPDTQEPDIQEPDIQEPDTHISDTHAPDTHKGCHYISHQVLMSLDALRIQ
jgi:hypothetical protein